MKKELKMKEISPAMRESKEADLSIASEELIGSTRPLIEQAKARVSHR
jgi:hypothetical protein